MERFLGRGELGGGKSSQEKIAAYVFLAVNEVKYMDKKVPISLEFSEY
jgi:hypothetical protein